jgi:flagellar biosynthesis regulator FlaF
VSEAVGTAASAARADGMSAAQFVIWVKKIWDQIMDEGGLEHSVDPARERDVVISAAIKAYYVQ